METKEEKEQGMLGMRGPRCVLSDCLVPIGFGLVLIGFGFGTLLVVVRMRRRLSGGTPAVQC